MSTQRLARAAGLSLLAALASAPLNAQQTPPPGPELTLEQAVAAARENNPDMQAQRNDAVASRAAVRNARADFLPSANASAGFGYTASGVQRFGSEVFGERPEYYSSNWSLGLSYDISGAKLMQPRIARAQQAATESRIVGYEANLVMQVKQQYLTVLQAGELSAQAQRELDRTREHERLANARLEVGTGTPLDVRRAQVERGRAEVALVQQQNTYETELLRLGMLMGVDLAPRNAAGERLRALRAAVERGRAGADGAGEQPHADRRARQHRRRPGTGARRPLRLPPHPQLPGRGQRLRVQRGEHRPAGAAAAGRDAGRLQLLHARATPSVPPWDSRPPTALRSTSRTPSSRRTCAGRWRRGTPAFPSATSGSRCRRP